MMSRLLVLLAAVALLSGTACGSSSGASSGSGTSGSSSGSSSTGSSGSTGGAANSVDARVPSGTISFAGEATAFYVNTSGPDLSILINEGTASCTATPAIPSTTGKHVFELDLVGISGSAAAFSPMTYSDSNSSSTYVHAEAYLRSPCPTPSDLAGNGGSSPYSVTITSIDASQIAGTFAITMTEHVSGGQNFQATGSFSAPICGHGSAITCN